MSVRLENWRNEEESLKNLLKKYPKIPKFVALKIDLKRRGYSLTAAARGRLNKEIHQIKERSIFLNRSDWFNPSGLILRDGTSIVSGYSEETNTGIRDPYLIDVVDGKLVITDQNEVLEEVEYWEKPDYYDKVTSKGTPMWHILSCRPQRLDISVNSHCHFWNKAGGGCKYCCVGATGKEYQDHHISPLIDIEDLVESVKEAIKQKGRFTTICATGGSILSGKELLDDEVGLYIEVFKALGDLFQAENLRGQIIGTAYSKKQLERLKKETGIIAYTTDLEVMSKELFEWICPGKTEYIGFDAWKQSLYDAVEVFGRNNVSCGFVGGVDMAKPKGFLTEAESLNAAFDLGEELAEKGVIPVEMIWEVGENTIFKNQAPPSLEYYIKLAQGMNAIREKHGLEAYFDDYRRCGNHPGTDLARI